MFSCSETDYSNEDCNYENCDTQYPTYGTIYVKVGSFFYNESIPITIYEGYYEDGNVYLRDTIRDDTEYEVPTETYITVSAEYTSDNGKKYYAIDGGTIEVKTNKCCDSLCYSTKILKINVKNKY